LKIFPFGLLSVLCKTKFAKKKNLAKLFWDQLMQLLTISQYNRGTTDPTSLFNSAIPLG